MVLVIYRSISSFKSQNFLKSFSLCLRHKGFKRNLASEAALLEKREQDTSAAIHQKSSKPPFVKNLFIGEFDKDVLIYPEIFSIQHYNAFKKRLEELEHFFKDRVNSKDIDITGKIPDEIISQLKKFNVFGLQIPKEYGGLGLNATECAHYSEILAANSSISLLLSSHNSIGVQSILRFGSEEQKQKYLPKLASGEWIAAFCFSEEAGGSDLAIIECLAEKDDFEDSWIMNGKKTWVTNGENANVFTVLSKSTLKNQFGLTTHINMFIVEKDKPGVTVQSSKATGVRGVNLAEVQFKNVELNKINVLGNDGEGFEIAIDTLNSNRYTIGAYTVAMLKDLFKQMTEYIVHRKQFSKNLIESELIQKHCSDVLMTIYALESMTYLSAGLHDQFHNYDGSLENALIKVFAMEQGQKCIETCISLLGARALMENNPYEKYLRDFKTMCIFDGALDYTKLYISSMGLHHAGQSRQEIVAKLRNPFNYPGYIFKSLFKDRRQMDDNPKLNLELYLQLHATLMNSAKQLEYCVLRLDYAVTSLLRDFGADTLNHQIHLIRLASVVSDIFAMTAVLGRASRAYCTGLPFSENEVVLAHKFCFDAYHRVKANVNVIVSGDEVTGDIYYQNISENIFRQQAYFLEHPTRRHI